MEIFFPFKFLSFLPMGSIVISSRIFGSQLCPWFGPACRLESSSRAWACISRYQDNATIKRSWVLTHETQVVFNDLAGLLTRCERLLLVRQDCFSSSLCDDTQLCFKQFGHLMRGADSLGKTLMLGKTEGKRRGWQDEMVGWLHWLNGHEFEQTPRASEGQESLACCSPA